MDFLLSLAIESSSLTRNVELMKTLNKMLSDLPSLDRWEIILFDSSQRLIGSVGGSGPGSIQTSERVTANRPGRC